MSIYPVLSEQAQKSSDDGKEVTPVPIPNTEVKLFCADGSWGFPPVRVGRRWAIFFFYFVPRFPFTLLP